MSEVVSEPVVVPVVAQAEEAAKAVAVEAAKAAPAVLVGVQTPGKFTKANLRKVALSALKAFVVAASAVAVAKSNSLAGSHLTLTDIEAVVFSVGVAGGGAALKVVELYLED